MEIINFRNDHFNGIYEVIHKTYEKYMTIDLPDGNKLCYLEMYKNININDY